MAEKKTAKKKSEAPKKRIPRVKKTEEAPKPARLEHLIAPKPRFLPKGVEVYAGTGRRKEAAAHVYIFKGSGKIIVNSKPYEDYFYNRPILLATVVKPLKEINVQGNFDIYAKVSGGGIPSQADAMRLGIARALVLANPESRGALRSSDLLRRDPRAKERKKYGLKRARRAFQYTKR